MAGSSAVEEEAQPKPQINRPRKKDVDYSTLAFFRLDEANGGGAVNQDAWF